MPNNKITVNNSRLRRSGPYNMYISLMKLLLSWWGLEFQSCMDHMVWVEIMLSKKKRFIVTSSYLNFFAKVEFIDFLPVGSVSDTITLLQKCIYPQSVRSICIPILVCMRELWPSNKLCTKLPKWWNLLHSVQEKK